MEYISNLVSDIVFTPMEIPTKCAYRYISMAMRIFSLLPGTVHNVHYTQVY